MRNLEPIIGFSIFIIFYILLIKYGNKKRQLEYNNLINELRPNLLLNIDQANCSSMTLGKTNKNFIFKNCDIYLTSDALILLGYSRDSFFKQLSFPIILTKSNYYTNKFPFSYTNKIILFEDNEKFLKIKFGKKGIFETDVTLKIFGLNKTETNQITKVLNITL